MPEYRIEIDVKVRWWLRPRLHLPVAVCSVEFANKRVWYVVMQLPSFVPVPEWSLFSGRVQVGKFGYDAMYSAIESAEESEAE